MLRPLILALAFAGAASAQPTGLSVGLPEGWSDAERAFFAQESAGLSELTGLRPVWMEAEESTREVWIRAVSGFSDPDMLYQARDSAGVVTGSGWLTWSATADSALASFYHHRCSELRSHDGRIACRMRLTPEPDWATLLAEAKELGLWTLPDESAVTPPTPEGTLTIRGDGTVMTVETRDGRGFRAYAYWSPRPAQGPTFARAASLLRTVRSAVWERFIP